MHCGQRLVSLFEISDAVSMFSGGHIVCSTVYDSTVKSEDYIFMHTSETPWDLGGLVAYFTTLYIEQHMQCASTPIRSPWAVVSFTDDFCHQIRLKIV